MAEQKQCFLVDSSKLTGAAFGLDIGGSLTKLACVSKEKDGKKSVFTRTFQNDELEAVIDFLRQNCELGPPQSLVTVTGFGSLVNKAKLEQALNVKIQLVMEFGCFAKALKWSMKHLPLKDVFYPATARSQMEAMETGMAWMQIGMEMAAMSGQGAEKPPGDAAPPPSMLPPQPINYYVADVQEPAEHFPSLLVMIGSAVGFYTVFENAPVQFLEPCLFGGQSLTALSKLLLGTKDFEELMVLADKGDITGIDTCGFHLKKDAPKDDASAKLYTAYPEKEPAYVLGQANRSEGPFKKEDIAASIVRNLSVQMVCMAHLLAKMHNLKRIFFAGSLPQHPHMRYLLERFMLERLGLMEATNKDLKFGFLKNGGAYGAFGTLLS